jgi:hypothetical protein
VRAAWQAQLAAAGQRPGLRPALLRRRQELLPRFAAYYTQLQALPRQLRRRLQRRLKQSLEGVALLLALGQAPALAATITVDGTTCTLVAAITAANTDMATGGCVAGDPGADTLDLQTDVTLFTPTRRRAMGRPASRISPAPSPLQAITTRFSAMAVRRPFASLP